MSLVPESAALAQGDLERRLEQHRSELVGYCYRMLGSPFEAEDAVQDTFAAGLAWLRPLRGSRRAALLALPDRHQRLPGHAQRPQPARAADGLRPVARAGRVEPEHAARGRPGSSRSRTSRSSAEGDPAELAVRARRSAWRSWPPCSTCPPRQRAVLILCEVLRWKAGEVAELLETSVASVNSALQRARATLEPSGRRAHRRRRAELDPAQRELLDALRRRLRALRHRGADRAAPRGRDPVDAAVRHVAGGPRGHPQVVVRPGHRCAARASSPCAPTARSPSASTSRATSGSGHDPWALQVLEIARGRSRA